MLKLDAVLGSLRNNLSRDLLSRHWDRLIPADADPVSGHCAIAAEALYHLLGKEQAGFTPYVCKYHLRNGVMVKGAGPDPLRDETHWWIRGPLNHTRGAGQVIDPTKAQYNEAFPYHWGRGCGFQSPLNTASKRARILIERVEKDLGAAEVAAFRASLIAEFKKAQPGLRFSA
jgi:hypothetical protein